MRKKILSLLLALTLSLGLFPAQALAAETELPVEEAPSVEETLPAEDETPVEEAPPIEDVPPVKEMPPKAEEWPTNAKMIDTDVLHTALLEEERDQGIGPQIHELAIMNDVATVNYEYNGNDALIGVAVYDILTRQILMYNSTTISSENDGVALIPLKGTIPDEYVAQALLLQQGTMIPLCAKYTHVKNDVTIVIDSHKSDYEETDVGRVFSITVGTTHSVVTSVTYTLEGSTKLESGQLGTSDGNFTADILLEGGTNTFTVYVTTQDGAVVSKSVTASYSSGEVYDVNWDFEDFASNGMPLVPVYDDTANQSTPIFYISSNVVRLYFIAGSSYAQREKFITDSEMFSEKLGAKNALRMMQAKLTIPLTTETSLSKAEYDAIALTVSEYANLSSIVSAAEVELYYPNMGVEFVSSDEWGPNGDNDWWIKYIDADDAWQYDNYFNSDFLTDITLGVVDNGFHKDHVDLFGRIRTVTAEDSPNLQHDIFDNAGNYKGTIVDHGTHVAGIMAAISDNGPGLAGVLHNNGNLVGADIFPVDSLGASSSAILDGLANTVEAGAKVINFSIGSSVACDGTAHSVHSTGGISDASRQIGILLESGFDFIVVQSAGNGDNEYDSNGNIIGHHGVSYWNIGTFSEINQSNCYETTDSSVRIPVTKDDIISRVIIVSNLQADGILNETSNGIVDSDSGDLNIIAAPGTNIYSTIHTNEYVNWDGTSMAAPIVTSVCGMVWSVNRFLRGNTVVDIVMNNTRGIAQTSLGSTHTSGGMGIVNTNSAVEAAIETLPTHRTTIVSSATGTGIAAKITIRNKFGNLVGNSQGTFYSNSDGTFDFPKLPLGRYTVTVSADGYTDKEVTFSLGNGALYDSLGVSGNFSPLHVFFQNITLDIDESLFAGGEGTREYPFQISTPNQLNAVRYNLSAFYILINDINLENFGYWEPIGQESTPFTGTLDGNGYNIRNMVIRKNESATREMPSYYAGLFGYVNGGSISNLKISNAQVTLHRDGGDIISFGNVGGIAGYLKSGTIRNSAFEGNISVVSTGKSYARASGIVAIGINSTVENCYSNANIYAKASGMNTMAAGIVAWLDHTTISHCYTMGTIYGENTTGYCYVGGMNASGAAETGYVNQSVTLTDNIKANGTTNIVDNIGNFSQKSGNKVVAPNSNEAKMQSTYESLGWNFIDIWEMGNDYPVLKVLN